MAEEINLLSEIGEKNDFSTNLFQSIYSFPDCSHEMFNISFNPRSEIINKNLVIIKVINKYLYSWDFWASLKKIIKQFKLKYLGVTRIDLCNDFQYLKNGQKAIWLLEEIGKGKIINSVRGKKTIIYKNSTTQIPSYIRFGQRSAEVTTYIYNKTEELISVKDKPYIRQIWKNNNFYNFLETYRIEFSFKPDKLHLFDNQTGELIKLDLNFLELRENIYKIYKSLSKKYLKLKPNYHNSNNLDLIYNDEVNKLNYIDLISIRDKKGSTNYVRGIINFLEEHNKVVREQKKHDGEILSESREILKELYDLESYYAFRSSFSKS